MTPHEKLLKLQELHYRIHDVSVEKFHEGNEFARKETSQRLMKKYQNHMSKKELEEVDNELEDYFEKMRKADLPTKYQDPESYYLISELSTIIQNGISTCRLIHQETRKVTKLADMNFNFNYPKFGTINFGDLNARTYPCDNNEHLIVFEVELSTFCYLLCKIIVQLFPVYDSLSKKTLDDYKKIIDENITKIPDTFKRFKELIISFVTTGKATAAPPYEIKPQYNNFLINLTQAMEVFIMGHEYSHILLRHTEKKSLEKKSSLENIVKIRFSWNQEYEADHLGLPIALEGLHNIGYTHDFINYCGAETFFSGLEIIERAKCIVNSGDDTWYWRGCNETGPISDHPPSDDRRTKLRNQMKFVYGEKSLETSQIVETILKKLFEKFKPELLELYKEKNSLD